MDPQLDRFLDEVDQVDSLIKEMANGDMRAVQKADELIKEKETKENLGFNKTVINKSSGSDPGFNAPASQSQEEFMRMIASDAKERARARKTRKEKSDQLKTEGNRKFSEGRFEEAYKAYSEAMEVMKDNIPLWTNRAQTLIKLERYEEAIADCDFAFRIDENSLKAHVHKAKALALLGRFGEARQVLDGALERNAGSKRTVVEYHDLVDQLEKARQMECQAALEREGKSQSYQTVSGVLRALSSHAAADQPAMLYNGGIACLSNLLHTPSEKTLFRTEKGFEVVLRTPPVQAILSHSAPPPDNVAQQQTMLPLFRLLAILCTDCFENFQYLSLNFRSYTLKLLDLSFSVSDRDTYSAGLSLARAIVADKLSRRLCANLVTWQYLAEKCCSVVSDAAASRTSAVQLAIAEDLLSEKAVRAAAACVSSRLPTHLAGLLACGRRQEVVMKGLTLADQLLKEPACVDAVAASRGLWHSIIAILGRSEEGDSDATVEVSLGLLYNLMVTSRAVASELSGDILGCVRRLMAVQCSPVVDERLFRVLALLLPSEAAVDSRQLYSKLLAYHREHPPNMHVVRHSTRLLALLTKTPGGGREQYLAADEGAASLCALLARCEQAGCSVSTGNVCLALSHVLEEKPVARRQYRTDLCRRLLSIASNSSSEQVRGNAGVALSRLVRSDPRQMDTLRRLDGINILHHCVNFL